MEVMEEESVVAEVAFVSGEVEEVVRGGGFVAVSSSSSSPSSSSSDSGCWARYSFRFSLIKLKASRKELKSNPSLKLLSFHGFFVHLHIRTGEYGWMSVNAREWLYVVWTYTPHIHYSISARKATRKNKQESKQTKLFQSNDMSVRDNLEENVAWKTRLNPEILHLMGSHVATLHVRIEILKERKNPICFAWLCIHGWHNLVRPLEGARELYVPKNRPWCVSQVKGGWLG